MQNCYELYFNITSSHKKRQKNDMQTQFSYVHWLREAPKSTFVNIDIAKYKHELIGAKDPKWPVAAISYTNNLNENKRLQEKHLLKTNVKVSIIRKNSLDQLLTSGTVMITTLFYFSSAVLPILLSFYVSTISWITKIPIQC